MEKSYGNLSEKGTKSPRDGKLGRKDKNITGSFWEFQCSADMKFRKKRGTKRGVVTITTQKGRGRSEGHSPHPC